MCNKPWTVNPCKQAHSLFFWKWGICGDTHPHSRAFRLWVWQRHVVKQSCTWTCITWRGNSSKNLTWRLNGHSSGDTRPWHTCVEKGRRRERASGWEKKNKTSEKEETSDNIRRWKLTWALCTDNACHLCSYVTWQAGARKATWQLLHNMAAVFANTKTHSGLKQIIVYHGHETTLIVLLGLR